LVLRRLSTLSRGCHTRSEVNRAGRCGPAGPASGAAERLAIRKGIGWAQSAFCGPRGVLKVPGGASGTGARVGARRSLSPTARNARFRGRCSLHATCRASQTRHAGEAECLPLVYVVGAFRAAPAGSRCVGPGEWIVPAGRAGHPSGRPLRTIAVTTERDRKGASESGMSPSQGLTQ
jgi:hypothetical protein